MTLKDSLFGDVKLAQWKNGFKYFIGYKNYEKVILLCIKVPKQRGYISNFKETRYIPFLIKSNNDNQLSKEYREIWYGIRNTVQKGFDSKSLLVWESYGGKMNTHFHVKEIPKEGSQLFIVIYLICKINKNYYPQLFSEETKVGQIHH